LRKLKAISQLEFLSDDQSYCLGVRLRLSSILSVIYRFQYTLTVFLTESRTLLKYIVTLTVGRASLLRFFVWM